MTAFSLGTIWEETIVFLRRESSLLIPVALAIFGPMQVLLGVAMSGATSVRTAANAAAGAQMLLIVPALLMAVYGYLVISLIVLVPRISVGEALLGALKSLPRSLATGAIVLGGWMAIAIAIIVAATLGTMALGGVPQPGIMSFLIGIPLAVLMVRMLLAAPVLAMEKLAAPQAVRRIWMLGRQNTLRFTGFWMLFLFLGVIVALIDQLVIGSLLQLLKLAISDIGLMTLLQSLISAALQALLSMAMAVYTALIYRKIAAG